MTSQPQARVGPSAVRGLAPSLLTRFLAASAAHSLNGSQHSRSGHGQYQAYQALRRNPSVLAAALAGAGTALSQLQQANLANQIAAGSVHGGSSVTSFISLGFPR